MVTPAINDMMRPPAGAPHVAREAAIVPKPCPLMAPLRCRPQHLGGMANSGKQYGGGGGHYWQFFRSASLLPPMRLERAPPRRCALPHAQDFKIIRGQLGMAAPTRFSGHAPGNPFPTKSWATSSYQVAMCGTVDPMES